MGFESTKGKIYQIPVTTSPWVACTQLLDRGGHHLQHWQVQRTRTCLSSALMKFNQSNEQGREYTQPVTVSADYQF